MNIEKMAAAKLFPGMYSDTETGYYNHGYRVYDPSIGAELQPDPAGILRDFSAPELQIARKMGMRLPPPPGIGDLNQLYAYASQNPVNNIDPTGLADCAYYADRCNDDGGTYYCKIAPAVCQNWPDDVPKKDWPQCVRKCLQQKDWQCDDSPNQCTNSGTNTTCQLRIHEECWTECWSQ